MKAVYEQHPAILLAVDRLEKAEQAKTVALTEIKYIPLGGPSRNGHNGHMLGYHFSMETSCGNRMKVATVLVDSPSMTIEVCIGWDEAFSQASGMAICPYHVKKHSNAPKVLQWTPMDGEIDDALKNARGEEIAMSFHYDLRDVEAAAEMVVAFLVRRTLPAELKYL